MTTRDAIWAAAFVQTMKYVTDPDAITTPEFRRKLGENARRRADSIVRFFDELTPPPILWHCARCHGANVSTSPVHCNDCGSAALEAK